MSKLVLLLRGFSFSIYCDDFETTFLPALSAVVLRCVVEAKNLSLCGFESSQPVFGTFCVIINFLNLFTPKVKMKGFPDVEDVGVVKIIRMKNITVTIIYPHKLPRSDACRQFSYYSESLKYLQVEMLGSLNHLISQ